MTENPLRNIAGGINRFIHHHDLPVVDPNVEISLSRRADLIVESWDKAISNKKLSFQELSSFVNTKEAFEDTMQVYLGIKPMADFLSMTARNHSPSFYRQGFRINRIIFQLPKAATLGFTVLSGLPGNGDIDEVWNPQLVAQVLKDNEDLVVDRQIDPFNPKKFLNLINSLNTASSNDICLEGIILGYPRTATSSMGKVAFQIGEICEELSLHALKNKKLSLFDNNSYHRPLQQITASQEVKRRLVGYASEINYHIDPEILNYILNSRIANVPGFKYGTLNGLTEAEEATQRQKWEASGIAKKVEKLLFNKIEDKS